MVVVEAERLGVDHGGGGEGQQGGGAGEQPGGTGHRKGFAQRVTSKVRL